MSGIRVAAGLHLLWGIYLTFWGDAIPRPIGALEPFLNWYGMTMLQLGIVFLVVGFIAVIKNFVVNARAWWLAPSLAIPQQIVLVAGLLGNIHDLFEPLYPERAALALCYILPITIFHSVDLFYLWQMQMIRRETA